MWDFNFHKKRSRKVPMLNTTSTADISFILLVFFLMVTSMDPDKGLPRQLPKLDEEKIEKITEIDKSNVLDIVLKADGKAYFAAEETPENNPQQRIVHFLESCPQPKKHVLTLSIEDDADYNDYFALQNKMILAYREVRERFAQKKYHADYLNLNSDQQAIVKQQYPQRIAEKY